MQKETEEIEAACIRVQWNGPNCKQFLTFLSCMHSRRHTNWPPLIGNDDGTLNGYAIISLSRQLLS